jgi:flagellin
MTVINTNISANITANSLAKNERAMSQTMERLSTGMRINSASDDAAGLAISERMTSQVKGLDQAARNANDAISMLQTADGAAIEITNMLQRMRELTVQASSATNTAPDIANMDLEFKALASEIDRIVDSTQWNGENILNGEGGDNGSFTFQIGANDGQSVTVDFSDFNLAAGAGATEAVAGVAGVNQVDAVAAVTGVDQVDAVAAVDQVNYSAEVQGVTGSLQVEQADAKGAAAIPGVAAVEGVAATFTQAITDAEAALITGNLVISDGTTSVTVGAADITDLDSIVAAVNGQGLDFEVAKNEAGDGLVMTNSATGTAGTTPTVTATLSSGSIASVATGVTGVDAKVEQMDFAGVQAQFTLAFTDANAAALEGNFVISDGITSVSIADSDITDLDSIVAAVQATGDLDFNLAKNEAGTGLVATFKEVGAASAPTITASKTSTAEYTVTLTDADVAAMDGDFVIGDGTNSVTIETDKLASDTVAALATAINTASTGLNTLDFSVASDASGLVMTATAKGAMDEPTITSAQNEVLSIFKVGLDDTAAAAIVDNTFTISDASGTTVSVDDMTNVNDVASLVNAIKMAADYTSLDFEVTADSTIGLVMTARTGEGAIAQPSVTATDGSSSLVGSFSNPTPGEDADTFGASGDFGTNDAGYTSFGATGSSSVTGEAAIEGVRFEAYSAAVDFQAAVETVAYQAEVAFVAGVTEVAEVTGVTEVAGVTGVTGVAEVAEVAAKGAVVMTQNLGGMTATNATLTTTSANMLETLDKAINGVTTQRATFGSVMNRLEYTVDNLANVSQNTSASLSRIADADYAAETTELARTQIIQQAGTAMLSQANQQAQSVLALLK